MNTQQQRLVKVLNKMESMSVDDEDYANWFSDALDVLLNNFLNDDAFGTEGQHDPRGDGRDGEWSMFRVQGIDE